MFISFLWGFCPGGFWQGGFLSRGFLSGGLCPGGFCPGVFCPDTGCRGARVEKLSGENTKMSPGRVSPGVLQRGVTYITKVLLSLILPLMFYFHRPLPSNCSFVQTTLLSVSCNSVICAFSFTRDHNENTVSAICVIPSLPLYLRCIVITFYVLPLPYFIHKVISLYFMLACIFFVANKYLLTDMGI